MSAGGGLSAELLQVTNTDEWRHLKGGFIKLSTGQRKYIPLVVNHRETAGTVEGEGGWGGRRGGEKNS